MDNQTIQGANSKELLENVLFRETGDFVNSENKRIIGISAKSSVLGYETAVGELRITLKTTFRLIGVTQEGFFTHDAVEVESVRSIAQEGLQPSSCVFIRAGVVDCGKTGSSTVKCTANIEVSGWFIREKEITFLNGCMPEFYCKTAPIQVENVKCLFPEGLRLTFANETRMNVQSLVDYSVESTVVNVYPGQGNYRIEGDVFIRILAQSEDGSCFSQLFTHPFSSEISDERITSENDIDLDASVKNVELTLSEGDKRTIIADVDLSFAGTFSLQTEAERVIDVYSTTHEVTVYESLETFIRGFCLRSLHEKGTARGTPQDGVNEVCGVLAPAVSASYNKSSGNFSVDGIVQADVLYRNEKDKYSALTVEIPYQVILPVDFSCDQKLSPNVTVTNISARLRNGGDIDVLCELSVTVKGISTREVNIIHAVEIGGEKERNDFAVGLYIVREGESIWDVAKALGTGEDVLLRQNPDLVLPLKGGERVILFNEKELQD